MDNKNPFLKGNKSYWFLLVIVFILIIFSIIMLYFLFFPPKDASNVQNDTQSTNFQNEGVNIENLEMDDNVEVLVPGDGLEIVKANCTSCHSAKLIVQNRASREGWISIIRWMQKSQGLWELGENEEIILDYLAKHYPPEEKGRRANLEPIEWYELEQK